LRGLGQVQWGIGRRFPEGGPDVADVLREMTRGEVKRGA
jgi:hypothetical protein